MNKIYKKIYILGALGLFLGAVFACSEEEPVSLAPTFNMNEASEILRTSATFSGSISGETSHIKEYGFDYSLSEDFTTNLTTRVKAGESFSSGSYQVNVKGLEANERYYYRMYATTGISTVYSASEYFQTSASSAPIMSALVVDSIGEDMARFKCTIEEIGDEYLIEYGVGYKTAAERTYYQVPSDSIIPVSIAGAENTFYIEISGLESATKYSFRPYAKNSADANGDSGTREGYGTILERQTENRLSAVVTTAEILEGNVGINSVNVSGRVDSATGSNGIVDVCGFCWSQTNMTPSIVDSHMEVKVVDLGDYFSGTITGLQPGMTYYVRAYAKNTVNGAERIGYGEVYEVTTTNLVTPVLEWSTQKDEWGNDTEYAKITPTSLSLRAYIKNYDEVALVEKGIIWDLNNGELSIEKARVNKTYVKVDNGANIIDATIKNLEIDTRYYVRAYAIYQAAGLEEVGYTPYTRSVSTESFNRPYLDDVEVPVDAITRNSAKLIGKISSNGNGTITERGFCISLSSKTSNPSINNCDMHIKSDDSFVSNVNNLNYNTFYAVRSYAVSKLEAKIDTTYCNSSFEFRTNDIVFPTFNNVSIDEDKKTYKSVPVLSKIVELGDGTLIEKGFVWSDEYYDVTLDNASGSVVVKTDDFSATVNQLASSKLYRFRAYAKVKIDSIEYVRYSDVSETWTKDIQYPEFDILRIDEETKTFSSLSVSSKIANIGDGTLVEKGFVWSEEYYDVTLDNATGSVVVNADDFATIITKLNQNTRYIFRAYVKVRIDDAESVWYSGSRETWTKEIIYPQMDLDWQNNEIKALTAKLTMKIASLGDGEIIEQGFCWYLIEGDEYISATLENCIGSMVVKDGTSKGFSGTITGLMPSSWYSFAAYMKMKAGDVEYIVYRDFGTNTGSFSIALNFSDLTVNSFKVTGYIDDELPEGITEYGFCWTTNENEWGVDMPNQIKASMPNENGEFFATIDSLSLNTTYYVGTYVVYKGKKIYCSRRDVTLKIPTLNDNSSPEIKN